MRYNKALAAADELINAKPKAGKPRPPLLTLDGRIIKVGMQVFVTQQKRNPEYHTPELPQQATVIEVDAASGRQCRLQIKGGYEFRYYADLAVRDKNMEYRLFATAAAARNDLIPLFQQHYDHASKEVVKELKEANKRLMLLRKARRWQMPKRGK